MSPPLILRISTSRRQTAPDLLEIDHGQVPGLDCVGHDEARARRQQDLSLRLVGRQVLDLDAGLAVDGEERARPAVPEEQWVG